MVKLDCGHTSRKRGEKGTSGVARTTEGATLCYACAEARERATVAEAPEHLFGYLADNGRTVTTWTGAELLTVTSTHERTLMGFGHPYKATFVQATTPGGARYWGRGPGCGMYVGLKRKGGQ